LHRDLMVLDPSLHKASEQSLGPLLPSD
jgi:hypothetical protein